MRTLALMLPLALAFAQPPAPTEPIDPKKLGAIEGKVTNGLTGEAQRRVNLTLRSVRMQGKQQMAPVGGGQSLDTGEFRIANLSPGRYWLSATDRNRRMMMADAPARNTSGKPEEELVTTYYPSSTDQAGARPIELTASQTLNAIDITEK